MNKSRSGKAHDREVRLGKTKSEKRDALPSWVPVYVWARAGGRCHICNEPVWKDLHTTKQFNRGKLAHIVGARPNGPRGHPTQSALLAKDPANLLLLCGTHHDLIDNKEHVSTYPVEDLRAMKLAHEARIEQLGSIAEDRKSVPVVVQIPIAKHADPFPVGDVGRALAAQDRYPDDQRKIEINLLGMTPRDHDASFWAEALKQMTSTYDARLAAQRGPGPLNHLSIFAMAPIPLLMAFGRHVGDKVSADVYNLHRTPKGWTWPKDQRLPRLALVLPRTQQKLKDVALVLSITSEVQPAQYAPHLPRGAPVFGIRVKKPEVDSLRHPDDLALFVRRVRQVMEAIHQGGAQRVHVFAGIPVAAAVEFGRALLPKLHATLVVYDFNRATGGWQMAFEL